MTTFNETGADTVKNVPSNSDAAVFGVFADAFLSAMNWSAGRSLESPDEIVSKGASDTPYVSPKKLERGAYAGTACAIRTVKATLGRMVASGLEKTLLASGWALKKLAPFVKASLTGLFGAAFRDASGFGSKTACLVCAAVLCMMLSAPLPSHAAGKEHLAAAVAGKMESMTENLSTAERAAAETTRSVLGAVLESRFSDAVDAAASGLFRTDRLGNILAAGEALAEHYEDAGFRDALVVLLAAREMKEDRVRTSDWRTGTVYRDMLSETGVVEGGASSKIDEYGGSLGMLKERMIEAGMLTEKDVETAAEKTGFPSLSR